MSQRGREGSGGAHGVDCPDCRGRDWEITLRKRPKAARHPQDRPGVMGRLLVCFAMVFVGFPLIATLGYGMARSAGALGAVVGVSGAIGVLVTLILVIEGFGSSKKIGALRCKRCGFEQRAPIGSD